MKKLIKVTIEDIKLGSRINGHWCPVARAVRRKLNNNYHCLVGDNYIDIYLGGVVTKTIPLHERVCDFIFDFDTGKKVEPLNFYIDLDETSLIEGK